MDGGKIMILFLSVTISCYGNSLSKNTTKVKPSLDTVYYVSFLDLVEKKGVNGLGYYINDYDLRGEKEVMNQIVIKLLKKNFTLLHVPDSCYKELIKDSTSRRCLVLK